MFDLSHYDSHGRRALAEAMGYPKPVAGWVITKPMPDPLRNDGDAWRLLCWLVDSGWEIGTTLYQKPDNHNEALVSAALAWLGAKAQGGAK